MLSREYQVQQCRILHGPLTGRRFPRAGGQGVRHHASFLVVEAKDVPDLVLEHRKQVHAILLALIAGRGEFGIVPRRRIDEPAPARGVVIEVDGVASGEAEGCAAKIGDADVDAAQQGSIDASSGAAINHLGQQVIGLIGRQRCADVVVANGSREQRRARPDPPREDDTVQVRPVRHGPRRHEVVACRGQPLLVAYEKGPQAGYERCGLHVERRVSQAEFAPQFVESLATMWPQRWPSLGFHYSFTTRDVFLVRQRAVNRMLSGKPS